MFCYAIKNKLEYHLLIFYFLKVYLTYIYIYIILNVIIWPLTIKKMRYEKYNDEKKEFIISYIYI
jgi:hypothetical protein